MSNKFIDDEPVLATALAGAVVSAVLSVLVTHGVITGDQASADAKTFVPLVAAAVLLAFGVVARKLVTPAKKVEELVARSGLLSDIDFGRIEALIMQHVAGDQAVASHPDLAEDASVPDGLAAGAPTDPGTPPEATPAV